MSFCKSLQNSNQFFCFVFEIQLIQNSEKRTFKITKSQKIIFLFVNCLLKSDNLQCDILLYWFTGMNDSSTKSLIFRALFFFIISYILRALKTLYFNFSKFIKKLIEMTFAKNFARNCEKKDTWNIRCLVHKLFVPANQLIILYCRLSDFYS